MNTRISRRAGTRLALLLFALAMFAASAQAQEKIRIAFSSTDSLNGIWTVAQEAGFYKKHGLDADVVYIGSSTVAAAAVVSQDVQLANIAGSVVAASGVRGGDLVSVGCFVNSLAYELVVLESVKSPEDLKGKSIGISRFGSVSDVAARELLKGIGLRPGEEQACLREPDSRGGYDSPRHRTPRQIHSPSEPPTYSRWRRA